VLYSTTTTMLSQTITPASQSRATGDREGWRVDMGYSRGHGSETKVHGQIYCILNDWGRDRGLGLQPQPLFPFSVSWVGRIALCQVGPCDRTPFPFACSSSCLALRMGAPGLTSLPSTDGAAPTLSDRAEVSVFRRLKNFLMPALVLIVYARWANGRVMILWASYRGLGGAMIHSDQAKNCGIRRRYPAISWYFIMTA
jgi:hypothetical protein